MKIQGSVALVTGTHHAFGAAMVRALLARGAAKVHVATRGAGCTTQAGALPVMLDVTRPVQMRARAREIRDVTLLVNSIVHLEVGHSLLVVPQLVDAFAPVLAANGGGAVVNVLSVLNTDAPWHPGDSDGASESTDRLLGDGLRGRLAAQGTALLFLRATLVDAGSDDGSQGHWTLADHVARRVLDALEAGGRTASGPPDATQRADAFGR